MNKLVLLAGLIALLFLASGCIGQGASVEKSCFLDSDCKFFCGCGGCMNKAQDCNVIAYCDMPAGDCKCVNFQCEFVEKQPW